MARIKTILLYLWQLPQNIAGLIVLASNARTLKKYDGYYIVKHLDDRAISLGKYLIFDSDRTVTEINFKHEQGHQKQSLYLGWLYLILIGLPSFLANLIHRKINFDYYSTPWEAWADKLGKVERGKCRNS